MNLHKMATATFLMALIVSNPASGQEPGFTAASPYDPRVSYEQIIILMQQPESPPIPQPLMNATLQGLPLAEIAKRSLRDDQQLSDLAVQFRPIPGGLGGFTGLGTAGYLTLLIRGDLPNDEQKKLWVGVANEFGERLSKAVTRVEQYRLAARKKQLDWLRTRVQEAKRDVDRYFAIIRELRSGQSLLSTEQLREQIEQLSERIREMKVKRIAGEARREATETQILKMRDQVEETSKKDPILDELARLVTLKEERLALIKESHSAGQVTQVSVAVAEAEIAEARIKLLEQQRKQVDPELTGRISTLNMLLADGMIDMVEARKVQIELDEQFERAAEQLAEMLQASTEEEIAQIRLKLAKERLANSIRELDKLEGQSLEPTRVKVIPWVE